jgi:Mg2+ and Co2+ transporter CorA
LTFSRVKKSKEKSSKKESQEKKVKKKRDENSQKNILDNLEQTQNDFEITMKSYKHSSKVTRRLKDASLCGGAEKVRITKLLFSSLPIR